MSAFKFTARIIAAAAALFGVAASCGPLLGDVTVGEAQRVESLIPDAAVGVEKLCDAGSTECDGRVLRLCTEDGTAWATREVCATPELCESSDVSTVSGCIPPKCAVDQMSCDENVLRLCNASRTGWEVFDTCESAAHCDAGRRQCLPAPCEPGDRRCNVGNLERCNDTSTGWEPLDTCETNELCEATLAPPATVGEVLSATGLPIPEVASDAEGPTECRTPICVPREVRCEAASLMACNEGQTDFFLAEECATPRLCDASITYTGLRGSPRCVRPVCAEGEHRCTAEGVLEVCNAARDGFDSLIKCIGQPFCNAVAADNGTPEDGCEDAPCAPGEDQCNGPQIQRCLLDQTGFENVGAPCETRGLCNDDGAVAFCQAPVCQRGPLSGTEFRCEGAALRRCNDQHTGYDTINTCATAGLCNAGLGFAGCQPPACAPGETRCGGDFVQRCNAERTGFESVEQCTPGTCDGTLGRCADPCILGSARCNAQGNLEECRNLLVGREITASCGSPQLCDAAARTCRPPPPGCTADGVRRCRQQGSDTVLEVCSDGRSRFTPLDTCRAGEFCDPNDARCDVCQQGSGAVCEGNTLVTCAANGQSETATPCPNGCQTVEGGPDRCRNCVPGTFSCQGSQLSVCRRTGGEEFLQRESCDTAALCSQTVADCLSNGSGENCRCNPGVCDPGDRDCEGAQPVICNADQTDFIPNGRGCGLEENCDPRPAGACFACAEGDVRCGADSILEGCRPDRSGFEDLPAALPGEARCIEDNRGARAQSCNGAALVDDRCQSNLCEPGTGCAECNPAPGQFVSECVGGGVVARTVCVEGIIQTQACPSGGGCLVAVCEGNGSCDTADRPNNTACTRGGGAGGFCQDGSCVQCLSDEQCPDDTNECTARVCSANTCVQAPRDGAACTLPGGGDGECNGAVCEERQICDPGEPRCAGALFQRCNAEGTAFVTEETCASAALCSNEGCGTPCDATQCDFGCNTQLTACNPCVPAQCNAVDTATCTQQQCAGTECVETAQCELALCINGACRVCAGTIGCGAGQTCVDNACVAACIPGECPLLRCNPQGTACDTCVASDCGGGDPASCTTTVCNGGTSCEPATRDGESCGTNGTCNGAECVEATGAVCGDGVCDEVTEILTCLQDCLPPP